MIFPRCMWRTGNIISAATLCAAAAGISDERRRANSFSGEARPAGAGSVRARNGARRHQLRAAGAVHLQYRPPRRAPRHRAGTGGRDPGEGHHFPHRARIGPDACRRGHGFGGRHVAARPARGCDPHRHAAIVREGQCESRRGRSDMDVGQGRARRGTRLPRQRQRHLPYCDDVRLHGRSKGRRVHAQQPAGAARALQSRVREKISGLLAIFQRLRHGLERRISAHPLRAVARWHDVLPQARRRWRPCRPSSFTRCRG